jgi:hypothetical protein
MIHGQVQVKNISIEAAQDALVIRYNTDYLLETLGYF